MSTFTRKAFPPLPIGATNRSGSVNMLSRANRVNMMLKPSNAKNKFNHYINTLKSQFSTRKDMNNAINRDINISVNDKRIIRERLNAILPKAKILQFSNTVTANNGSTRKIRNNKNTRGKIHAFSQETKPSIFNFSFLNPFARQKKTNAAAYQNALRESRFSLPRPYVNEMAATPSKSVAKLVANLSLEYNDPADMVYAADELNINNSTKLELINYIKKIYNVTNTDLKRNDVVPSGSLKKSI